MSAPPPAKKTAGLIEKETFWFHMKIGEEQILLVPRTRPRRRPRRRCASFDFEDEDDDEDDLSTLRIVPL